MASLKLILLVCAVTVAVLGQDGHINPEPPITNSTVAPTTSTSIKPSTKTTPTTTIDPTTTSTASTTTTITPEPTTKSTTTVPPTTSTTTTSTTAKPTTPTPTPAPVDPQVANWIVNYANSKRSCIVIEIAVQYEILEPKSNKTIKINVPADAKPKGACEKEEQFLQVIWDTSSLRFDFLKTNTSKFELENITSVLNISLPGTGPKVYNLVHKKPEFSTPLKNSYKCAHVQTLNLTEEGSNDTFAYLHISHAQFQAFRNSTEHKFDSALDCEESVTPDVVPIVVGCVLAALVVMVLIAYLIGRRRCQARGYLSM